MGIQNGDVISKTNTNTTNQDQNFNIPLATEKWILKNKKKFNWIKLEDRKMFCQVIVKNSLKLLYSE